MSLPAWECGLKLDDEDDKFIEELSLPAWECGLKHMWFCGTLRL